MGQSLSQWHTFLLLSATGVREGGHIPPPQIFGAPPPRCPPPKKIMPILYVLICYFARVLILSAPHKNHARPPPPTKVMKFCFVCLFLFLFLLLFVLFCCCFCLSACSAGKWGHFWRTNSFSGGVGGGGLSAQILVPPYESPSPPPPPQWKFLATPLASATSLTSSSSCLKIMIWAYCS